MKRLFLKLQTKLYFSINALINIYLHKGRYIRLIVLALLMYSFFSCEDYLETESNSTFTEKTSFINLDFATKSVYGIYANLASNNLYDNLFLNYKFDSDIEFSINPDDGSVRSLNHYAGNEGTTTLKHVWNTFYQTIERSNICIDNLPKSSIWKGEYAEEAHQLYGEAVTLRALCYYELINTWGDVPFTVKSTQAGDDFYLPKTDRDSICEYLVKDLADVEEYLPWMSETMTTERINKAFAKGLRARISLSYAGYSLRNKTFETRRGRYWEDYLKIANQECREIIESGKHQLNPSFQNIFKTLHSYTQDLTYKEVLFEVAFGRLYSGRLGRFIGMPIAFNDTKYGGAYTIVVTPPNYYYSFDNSDKRKNVSVELYNYNNTKDLSKQSLISDNSLSFSPCKWRRYWLSPTMGGSLMNAGFTGVNWPVMRYADIVLMYAETENEINGPTQAAKDALLLVRKRAFPEDKWATNVTHYIDSVSTNKESFFNAIVDERAWEFGGGELIRKYDLVRWNLLGSKMKKMKEDWKKILNNDPTYANYNKVSSYIFWKRSTDGESIDILNPDYRLPGTGITGYTRASWLPLASDARKAAIAVYIDRIGHGYDETKNNHLYPISVDIITSSNGKLSNDQIP